eukprot:scaffold8.g1396.t1
MEQEGAGTAVTAATAAPVTAARLEDCASGAKHQRCVPDEVAAAADDPEYLKYREFTDIREPYRVPLELLVGTKRYVGPLAAESPLIVFINAKSGGRVGSSLISVLFRSLGQAQVFDVSESRPGPVLERLWANLREREAAGDAAAAHVRARLRVLVAGGDGTITWVLGTILGLGLEPPPPVAVMPLGTGNDLSLSFGWGNFFQMSWIRPAQPLRNKLRLCVRAAPGGAWEEVEVPPRVRAIVLLNLQSYGGGRDIWGLSDTSGLEQQGYKPPSFSDGLIEASDGHWRGPLAPRRRASVVGFGTGWHAAAVMGQISPRVHALRLAQCAEVELELAAGGRGAVRGDTGLTHMQVDGEPWPQHIPLAAPPPRPAGAVDGAAADGSFTAQPLRVRISRRGQSRLLFNSDIQGGPKVRRLASRVKAPAGAEEGG